MPKVRSSAAPLDSRTVRENFNNTIAAGARPRRDGRYIGR